MPWIFRGSKYGQDTGKLNGCQGRNAGKQKTSCVFRAYDFGKVKSNPMGNKS